MLWYHMRTYMLRFPANIVTQYEWLDLPIL